jgi:enterochelin esterase-like enzyme
VRLCEYNHVKDLPIVVLLPSSNDDLLPGIRRRHLEYGDFNLPFAQAHADFVANTAKPYVDANFNTRASKKHTFAIGSSMGGQASLHLLLRHADTFGGAACMSPYFGPATMSILQENVQQLKGKRIYVDIGGDSEHRKVPFVDLLDHFTNQHWWNPGYFWLDTQLQSGVKDFCQVLDGADIQYEYREFPGARHNERAWSMRIDKPLQYLLASS